MGDSAQLKQIKFNVKGVNCNPGQKLKHEVELRDVIIEEIRAKHDALTVKVVAYE